MNFIKKKRKPPIVPIVSLIDILAIPLIFFIATSTFKELKAGVDIEPPPPGSLTTRPVEDTRTTLAVTADNQIFLGNGRQPIEARTLVRELSGARAAGTKLELKADERADFGLIVMALDAIKKAGYKNGECPTILKLDPKNTSNPTPYSP